MDWKGGDMIGLQKIAISAAIGGTAEALGGGKFANGAVTGAYVYLLNHMSHTNTKGEGKKQPKPKRVVQKAMNYLQHMTIKTENK